jgi:hypothetical protein
MKKSALIIAMFVFGTSFATTQHNTPLPKVSLTTLSMGAKYVTTYARALYDKGGNDTCSSGINLGRTLYASTPTIVEGTQLYTDSTGGSGSVWTGATSTYYRLAGTSSATVKVNSTGLVTYVACGN